MSQLMARRTPGSPCQPELTQSFHTSADRKLVSASAGWPHKDSWPHKNMFRAVWLLAAVLVSVFSLSAQQIDIRDHGAKCNGGDDTAAVQSALNAVPNGGTVVFSCQAGIGSAGIYLGNKSKVVVTATNGGGYQVIAGTTRGMNGFRNVHFIIENCTSCIVQNLNIDVNGLSNAGLGFNGNTNTIVQNNTITDGGLAANNAGGGGAALVTTANHNNRYIGNFINRTYGCGHTCDGTRGMWIGNASSTTYEWNPYIANNHTSGTGHTGIPTHTVGGATIVGNLIENLRGGGAGIKVTPGPDSALIDIEDNVIRNNTEGQGIQIEVNFSNALANILIKDNTISGLSDSGIYGGYGLAKSIVVDHNTFSGTHAGFTLFDTTNTTFSNNTFAPVQGSCGRVQTYGNTITSNIMINNNDCRANTSDGFQVGVANGSGNIPGPVVFQNNSITNSSRYGIEIVSASGISNVSQTGNCFSGNALGNIRDARSILAAASSSSSCTSLLSVSLASPLSGANFTAPASIPFSANVTAGSGGSITKVEYFNGSTKLGEATSSPYAFTQTNVGAGTYLLTAKATDGSGATATSPTVTVSVANVATIGCDVNHDGTVNITDVQAVVNQALGLTACTTDLNGDGKCDVLDVQRVIVAALNGTCTVTSSPSALVAAGR